MPSLPQMPTSLHGTNRDGNFWRERRFPGLLLLAVLLRIAVLIVYPGNLGDDRDAYIALGQQLADGNGFQTSPEAAPTAYRPPLYPLVLSLFLKVLSTEASVATVNLLCSVCIVAFVWKLSREHWSSSWATLATLVVVCDPLLLVNISLPMTEVMFTALVLAVIDSAVSSRMTVRRRLLLGALFGLAALCRPTVWAFGAIAASYWVCHQWRAVNSPRKISHLAIRSMPVIISLSVVISPWVVRNAVQFRHLIPMTTHGGYTLLLANNEVFYEEVVSRGWRTTWSGDSLHHWQTGIEREMARATPPVTGEVEQSRWMSRRSWQTIRDHPVTFLHSCLTRLLRFWNPVPMSTPSRPVGKFVQWGLGMFQIALYVAVLISVVLRWRSRRKMDPGSDWLVRLCWCMIASLALVHLLYWSNARMRTPLEPLLILLALMVPASATDSRKAESADPKSL